MQPTCMFILIVVILYYVIKASTPYDESTLKQQLYRKERVCTFFGPFLFTIYFSESLISYFACTFR